MKLIISKSEKETEKIAGKLAQKLKGGEVIALTGNLGAGKTVFVRGLARSLGIKKPITSPTFVLMKLYKTQNYADGTQTNADIRRKSALSQRQSVKWLVHVDAYRIKNGQDLVDIGINDYLGKKDTVVVIEWADRVKKILPKKKIIIKINFGKRESVRMIKIFYS